MNESIFDTPREFLLLSGAHTSTRLCYDAEHFTIPAKDEIVKPNERAPHLPHSGKTSEGEWIPGSLLVRDIPGARGCPDDPTSDGVTAGNARGDFWDAKRAIMHCLGIDPITRKATSSYSDKGIVVLPTNPSGDLLRVEREKVAAKAKAFNIKCADQTVRDWAAEANSKKKNGVEPGLPGNDYYDALEILGEAKKEHKRRVAAMGMEDPFMDAAEGAVGDDDSELIALARIAAEKVAGKLSATEDIDKDAVIEMMLKDPEWMKAIKKQAQVRKLSKKELKDKESFGGV